MLQVGCEDRSIVTIAWLEAEFEAAGQVEGPGWLVVIKNLRRRRGDSYFLFQRLGTSNEVQNLKQDLATSQELKLLAGFDLAGESLTEQVARLDFRFPLAWEAA
jgi:hypothetical protein